MKNNWCIQGSSELARYFKTLPDVNWVGNNSNNYYYLDSDNTWTFNYFNYLSKTVITLKEYLNMNNKEIIGYKVKPEFIEVVRQIMTTKGYNPLFEFNGNSLTYTTLTGLRVLDLWCTEVYKQDVPTFKVGDIVVVTDSVFDTHNGDIVKITCTDLGCSSGLEYKVQKESTTSASWVKSVRKATEQEIKEYNRPKFKVSDYIVFEHELHTSGVYCLAIVNGANSKDDQGGIRDLNCGHYRYATPEEIDAYINKPKEFTIHSTSGNFKVEVSSKGIYVPSEKTWIDPNDLEIITSSDEDDYDTVEYNEDNEFSGVDSVKHWNITPATVHIGCKKNIPVEDIKAAVDYYNSL